MSKPKQKPENDRTKPLLAVLGVVLVFFLYTQFGASKDEMSTPPPAAPTAGQVASTPTTPASPASPAPPTTPKAKTPVSAPIPTYFPGTKRIHIRYNPFKSGAGTVPLTP